MTTRPRSARGEGANLRAEILDAAERLLLAAGGDDALSIRDVADAVGVTPPSIYRHFASKDELVLAVSEQQFAKLNDLMTESVKGAETALDELKARGEAYIRFGVEHPEAYVVMFMRPIKTANEPSVHLHNEPAAFAALVEAVERAMASGALRADDAHHAAQVIWATVHGLTSLLITQPKFPRADRRKLIDDVLFAAVAPFVPR